MVLQSDQTSPFEGALAMAAKSQSWSEESISNRNSPEESPNYFEVQPEDPPHFYPHLQPSVYVPYVPSHRVVLFAYPYNICSVVHPSKGLSVEEYHSTSALQEPSLEENYPTYNEALSSIAKVEESLVTAADTENPSNDNAQFYYGWNFLTHRDSSISIQQFPSHSSKNVTSTFDFPAQLCGRLIGKKGRNICRLMHETCTRVTIYKDEEDETKQILKVSGAESQVLEAAWRIEERLARKESSPVLTNSRVLPIVHPTSSIVNARQMELPINVEVNVVISSIFNAGHFYLAMPRSSAAPIARDFEKQIDKFYNSGHIPRLTLESTLVGTYCVGNLDDMWFRVQVIGLFHKAQKAEVLLLDYGKFAIIPFMSLRKMRADFLDIPFQAIECCLANIIPRGCDYFFPLSSTNMFEKLTEQKKLKAISRGIYCGISTVDLYSIGNNARTWINQMLVDVGVAQWGDMAL